MSVPTYKFNQLNEEVIGKEEFRASLIAGGFSQLEIDEMEFVKNADVDDAETWENAPYIPKGAKVHYIGCDTEVVLLEDNDYVLGLLKNNAETYKNDELKEFDANLTTLELSETFGTSKFCLWFLGDHTYASVKDMRSDDDADSDASSESEDESEDESDEEDDHDLHTLKQKIALVKEMNQLLKENVLLRKEIASLK